MIGAQEIDCVNLRDVHQCLEVKKYFSNLAKAQLSRFWLLQNRDYVIVKEGNGPRKRIEYKMTRYAAVHIAAASETDKGFELRDHLFEIAEKSLHVTPQITSQSDRIKQLEETILAQNRIIASAQKPNAAEIIDEHERHMNDQLRMIVNSFASSITAVADLLCYGWMFGR